MTINVSLVLIILLLFVIFDIVPDMDHYRLDKKFSFKYKVVQLFKGWLGLDYDKEIIRGKGILHNFYVWFIIFLIGLLGMLHIFIDKV